MLWPRPSAPESTPWGTPSLAAEPVYIPIDSNGNLTTKTEGSDTWGYEWNARNELTRVTKNSVEQARFSYDPLGRRVEKVAGGVTASYTYDREDVLREIRGSTTLKYVHGPGVDVPLASEDGSGALTYYHADGLGSVVKRSNQAGAVLHEYRYDAWGNIEAGVTEPGYAFTGREWDPETGLYYYRARYYDPKPSRFASEDPIGLRGGANRYAYVFNLPTRLIDPSGNDWRDAAKEMDRAGPWPWDWWWTGMTETMEHFPGPRQDRERHCFFSCITLRRGGPFAPPWIYVETIRKVVPAVGAHVMRWLGLPPKRSSEDYMGDYGADWYGVLVYPLFWKTCEELCRSCPANR